jgi:hypothetical protein
LRCGKRYNLIVRTVARIVLSLALVFTTCPLDSCTVVQPPVGAPASTLGGSATGSSFGSGSTGTWRATKPLARVPAYIPVAEQSKKLTHYFKTHRLPLVGAKVSRDTSGHRRVMLYGFVATPFGKSDAENKARAVLNDPALAVENHIEIRPELLTMNAPSTPAPLPPPPAVASGTAPAPPGIGGVQAYENQGAGARQYQQYQQQQQQMDWLTMLLPLAASIGLSALGGGGAVSVNPGYGSYGSSPYGYYGGGYGYSYTYP